MFKLLTWLLFLVWFCFVLFGNILSLMNASSYIFLLLNSTEATSSHSPMKLCYIQPFLLQFSPANSVLNFSFPFLFCEMLQNI